MDSRQERLLDLLDRYQMAEEQGRPVSVDRLCADCPELLDDLRQQVELHRGLKHLANCDDSATLPAGTNATSKLTAALPRIPGYKLLRELGRGGMGVVFEARHLGLNRLVALKVVLGSDLAGPEALARFRGEAETLACLHHPNVVQVFDCGEHDGRPFFVMELVCGGSLKDRMTGTPLSPRAGAELVLALARAVQAAHERGVVHRDLKPANVLLDRDGQNPGDSSEAAVWGIPKVSDFGLAKRLDSGAEQTRTGAILGTPSHMAPEQAAGGAKGASLLVDVYALGAVLYECLTGRPPFRGETPLDTIQQVLRLEPVPPRRLQPGVPRDLQTICLKCLEKDPGRRYRSAQELADDLGCFLESRPLRARPPSLLASGIKWTRRHPAAAAMIVLLLLLVATLTTSTAMVSREKEETKAAKVEAERALADAERANASSRRSEEEANASRYASDVRLADQLYQAGDVFHLAEILDRHVPPAGASEDRRGFEWWYLRRHANRIRLSLAAHSGPVDLLEYLPGDKSLVTVGANRGAHRFVVWDLSRKTERFARGIRHDWRAGGQALAAVTRDGTLMAWGQANWDWVSVWDEAAGKELFSLPHPGHVYHLAFSPDGKSLATCGDGWIMVWDPRTGKERFPQVKTPAGLFVATALTDDSLVVGGHQSTLRNLHWYSLETGKLTGTASSEAGVLRLSCSPRGSFLLVIGGDRKGRVWDNPSRLLLPASIDGANWLATSPDERTLAAAVNDSIELYDTATWRRRAVFRWQARPIVKVAFSQDGRALAAATNEGKVYELDAGANHVPDHLSISSPYRAAIDRMPDGKGFAVVTADGEVESVDFRTGRSQTLLKGCGKYVRRISLSPDSRWVAIRWDRSNDVGIWDAKTGRLQTTLKPGFLIRSVAFAPDGRRIAACDDKAVRFWDPETGTVAGGALYPPGGDVCDLAFTTDGKTLMTAGASVCTWNVSGTGAPREPACTVPSAASVFRVAVSRDGKTVATQEREGKIQLWGMSKDRKLSKNGELLPGGMSSVYHGLSFSRNGKSLLTVHDHEINLWALPGRGRVRLTGRSGFGALSADGKSLATASLDGALELWDAAAWRVRHLGARPKSVRSLAFSPDGKALLAGCPPALPHIEKQEAVGIRLESLPLASLPSAVSCWDPVTAQQVPSGLPAEDTMALPYLVAWSARGLAAAGCSDGSVRVWNPRKQKKLIRRFLNDTGRGYVQTCEFGRRLYPWVEPDYARHVETASALGFSPDGRWLAVAGNRGSLWVWDAEDWSDKLKRKDGDVPVEWVGFSPDSKQLAVAQEGKILFFDLGSKQRLATVGNKDNHAVTCGAFSPSGSLLAVGGRDGDVRVWDLRTGELRNLLVSHQDRVTALAFSPDGKTLASGSWDHSVRLWSVAVGQEVAVLRGHGGKVGTLAFSPDGRTLASGSEDGQILLWRSPRP